MFNSAINSDLIAVYFSLSSFSRNLQATQTLHHPLAVITSPDKTLPRDSQPLIQAGLASSARLTAPSPRRLVTW